MYFTVASLRFFPRLWMEIMLMKVPHHHPKPVPSTTFQLDPDHLTPGPSVSAESAPSMCDGTNFWCFSPSELKS